MNGALRAPAPHARSGQRGPRPFKDLLGGAASIHFAMGLEFFQTVALEFSGGGFYWGYPGETIAQGGFMGLGGGVTF